MDLNKANEHMRVKLTEVQSTLLEQSEFIEGKSVEKADKIMGQFQNILGMGEEEDKKTNHLKSKISFLQDDNLKLKELVSDLNGKIKESCQGEDENLERNKLANGDITQDSMFIKINKEKEEYKANLKKKE